MVTQEEIEKSKEKMTPEARARYEAYIAKLRAKLADDEAREARQKETERLARIAEDERRRTSPPPIRRWLCPSDHGGKVLVNERGY